MSNNVQQVKVCLVAALCLATCGWLISTNPFPTPSAFAQFPGGPQRPGRQSAERPKNLKPAPKPPKDAKPLNKQETVFADVAGQKLWLKGHVCLNKGVLELLACLKNSKEHEAIISIDTRAQVIHAGLLAIGAEQGKPVSFDPVFVPPQGQQIDIFIHWTDEKGKAQRVRAQEWIRYVVYKFYLAPLEKLPPEVKFTAELDDLRYDPKNKELIWYGPMSADKRKELLNLTKSEQFKAAIEQFYQRSQSRRMEGDWVFAGSGFYEDQATGQQYYRAEDGDLICVANFNSATIDIAAKSSADSADLLFEAWTERIPQVETEVLLELVPVQKGNKPAETDPDSKVEPVPKKP